jgi:hypothetical protein
MNLDNYKLQTPPDDGALFYQPTESEIRFADLRAEVLKLKLPDGADAKFHIDDCPLSDLKDFARNDNLIIRVSPRYGEYLSIEINNQITIFLYIINLNLVSNFHIKL